MYYLELLAGLWIGDAEIMGNRAFMEDNCIGVIYNCTDIHDFPACELMKIRVPFPSSQNDENLSLLQKNHRKLTAHIHENLVDRNVFIGCSDGKTISPLLVALYILHYGSLPPSSIYGMLLTKDPSLSLWCDITMFQ